MSLLKQFGQLIGMMIQNIPALTSDQMQRWIGDPQGMKEFLSGLAELRARGGEVIISFTLPPTVGTTGEQWIDRLVKKGYQVGDFAKELLRSPDFRPTTGVVYKVKVLRGESFPGDECTDVNIHARAEELRLRRPNAEIGCLIREKFTDYELGMIRIREIVVMHDPINETDGPQGLEISVHCDHYLGSHHCGHRYSKDRGPVGFAFIV